MSKDEALKIMEQILTKATQQGGFSPAEVVLGVQAINTLKQLDNGSE